MKLFVRYNYIERFYGKCIFINSNIFYRFIYKGNLRENKDIYRVYRN